MSASNSHDWQIQLRSKMPLATYYMNQLMGGADVICFCYLIGKIREWLMGVRNLPTSHHLEATVLNANKIFWILCSTGTTRFIRDTRQSAIEQFVWVTTSSCRFLLLWDAVTAAHALHLSLRCRSLWFSAMPEWWNMCIRRFRGLPLRVSSWLRRRPTLWSVHSKLLTTC